LIQVGKRRSLALDPLEHEVLLPKPLSATRVLVPIGRVQVDAAEHQDVGPAVSIEVVNPRKQLLLGLVAGSKATAG